MMATHPNVTVEQSPNFKAADTNLRPSTGHNTPSNEAFDVWFENIRKYEATLEEMARASSDFKFNEEMKTIEKWFRFLSEAERTASVYSLLQHCNQSQIKFFIAILQQMSMSDPLSAFLSPLPSESMKQKQANMSTRPSNLQSPSLGSPLPINISSPTSANPYLHAPASADAAATLEQQRTRLKASNPEHFIHPPVTGDGHLPPRPSSLLASVVEKGQESGESTTPTAARSAVFDPAPPPQEERWASMVNTPMVTMFPKRDTAPPVKQTEWPDENTVPQMGDPKIYRRAMSRLDDEQTRLLNVQAKIAEGFGSPRMGVTTPSTGITSFDMSVLSAMGVSIEAQMLAIQFGVVTPPTGTLKPKRSNQNSAWRPPSSVRTGSAGLASAGVKGAGLKSAPAPAPSPATATNNSDSAGVRREETWDPELLNDIYGWFKSERLHKYAPTFEGMVWQDMVVLDDSALESKGIAAVGARRRLLKMFELARVKMGMEEPPASGAAASA